MTMAHQLREWQKELVGLGAGLGVVHILIAAALVVMFVLALGRVA
jgi:hypothetical protein